MKNTLLMACATILTALGCGCGTVTDFYMPDGYDPGARKDVVVIKFRTPTLAADSGEKLTPADIKQLREFPKSLFIKNKRFVVLTDKPGEMTSAKSHDVEVWAVVSKLRTEAPGQVAYGAKVQFDVKVANTAAGAYEEAAGIGRDGLIGVAAPRTIPVSFRQNPRDVRIDWNGVFGEAYTIALEKMEAWLAATYPINATVVAIKNKYGKAELLIDRGTNYGMSSAHTYVVYYQGDAGTYTTVALASAQVGKTRSQLNITDWNKDEPEVANELMPRILSGDKTLLGKLFVVCR